MAPTHSTFINFQPLASHVSFFSTRLPARRSKKHVLNHHSAHTPSILLRMRFTYPAISAGYEIPNTTRLFAQIRSPKPASRHSSQENASQ